jgi:AhpD family alkylhydroperoxidase
VALLRGFPHTTASTGDRRFEVFVREVNMADGVIGKFQKQREELNKLVMDYAGQGTKRFYSLDSQAYREGTLPCKVKELLGLVASFVLRCDNCIKYHIIRCFEEGVSDAELEEALFIGLVVGGTITIPHQRRAIQAWDELKNSEVGDED